VAKNKGGTTIIIKKKGGGGHGGHHGGSWKVAYADFVTAMMAFFLLMWLIAAMKPQQKEAIAVVFKDTKAKSGDSSSVIMPTFIPKDAKMGAPEVNLSEKDKLKYEVALLVKELLAQDKDLQSNSGISSDNAGVLMQVNNAVMFAPNSAVLRPGAAKILDGVTNILLNQKVDLVIRGHTDDTENGSGIYPSKWELSAARAAATLRYILAKGAGAISSNRLRASGYADSRPLVPAINEENRAMNRRVEFYYHSPEAETW
jgi:Flagellar motor protein